MKKEDKFVRVPYGDEEHTVNIPAEFAALIEKQYGDIKQWVAAQIAEVQQSGSAGVLSPRRLGKIVRARVVKVVAELLEDF
ncbi:hypothetical protein [Azoarcus olearius]|uniref:hypothetical protein n=1 Tax=Azoarcus sp. (strain BH72) TaxID=418699 RepID=UPI0005A119EC|nr:hypothetical protein [Azoarcus olearius]